MKTGELYKNLFSDYSVELFDESVDLQIDRFKRWNLSVKDKICLDVGCGGGRTLAALKKLGAREVYGIDIDEELVNLAKKRSNAEVVVGSALDLPFSNNRFDLVICSGVLHHTSDIKKGIDEIHRVLKQGGMCYLLLYQKHYKWVGTKIMRLIGKVIPFGLMRSILFFLPANKRYLMDNYYVKYMHTLSKEKILSMLGDFSDIQEVDKGKPKHDIRLLMKKRLTK